MPSPLLLVGFGLANQAVARACLARGIEVVATDDRPGPVAAEAAASLGLALVVAPPVGELAALVEAAGALVPSPGLPEAHDAFRLAAARGRPVLSEFDLAAAWDDRPIAAVTGTDGKTTVTTMVLAMLRAGGIAAVDAGNNDLPLVAAIDDPAPDWFVVEASSFRLARAHGWAPQVACWLNLAPDHLDVHASHAAYEAAKASIWAHQAHDATAVGNLDDPVVARHLAVAPARQVGFSLHDWTAEWREEDGVLIGPAGPILAVADLPRALPHDRSNALAAAATAHAAGAPLDAIAEVLRTSAPLPHRVAPVATVGGVTYYDDSKATVPHATLAAVRGFESVVLLAGGRNKGLDLSTLSAAAPHLRAVVAIGEASGEVAAAFEGLRPVRVASSMAEAVRAAADLAEPGDAVVLSPACASFDWYTGYAARGDDFAAEVRRLEEAP